MTTTLPAIAPATYRIDPTRSTIRFTVRGLFGLATVRGTFTVRDGTIVVADEPARSKVDATIDAASFATGVRRRDEDIRSKRYLDTAAHPDIRFTSREVTAGSVTGILTVRGVGQRITLDFDPAATPGGCRFTSRARVDRYAFGVTSGKGMIARYVDVEIEVSASRT